MMEVSILLFCLATATCGSPYPHVQPLLGKSRVIDDPVLSPGCSKSVPEPPNFALNNYAKRDYCITKLCVSHYPMKIGQTNPFYTNIPFILPLSFQ